MKSHEFCYWLQGLFELGDISGGISAEKTEVIKKHLAMVFHHEIDPKYPQGAKLSDIHGGTAALLGDVLFRC